MSCHKFSPLQLMQGDWDWIANLIKLKFVIKHGLKADNFLQILKVIGNVVPGPHDLKVWNELQLESDL